MVTSEKPKKMRRRWPLGSGAHVEAFVVVCAADIVAAAAGRSGNLGLEDAGRLRKTSRIGRTADHDLIARQLAWAGLVEQHLGEIDRGPGNHRCPLSRPTIFRVAEAPMRRRRDFAGRITVSDPELGT